MDSKGHRKFDWIVVCVLLILGLSFVFTSKTIAADLTKAQFQDTLSETMKTLWTGQDFGLDLEQRQHILKHMLEKKFVSKTELAGMIEKDARVIVNNYKTSRYVLEDIGVRFNALLSPFLNWESVKETVIWDKIADRLNKEPFILKLATLAPEGTPWLDVPQTILVPRIIELTRGGLKPKFYTGGVMGEDCDVLRKMDIGQLDGCGCTTLGVVKASPDATVLMAPDLFRDYEEIDYVYRTFRKRLDQSFEKRGYICGAIIDTGFLYVFSKNRLTGLEDLRHQKALSSMGLVESTLLEELGVDAIPVAVPEVVSALSTGLADTFIAPPAWTLGMQAYQYVNYYIAKPFYYSPGVVLLSANTREKIRKHFNLPETLVFNTQELIVHEIKSIEPEWKKRGRIYEAKSLKAFEVKCGIKPVTLSAKDLKDFEKAARNVREKLVDKAFPAKLLNDVQTKLEQYRQQ